MRDERLGRGKVKMARVSGLIVINEMVCDECGRTMRHPARYGYIQLEEDEELLRMCEDCCREKGYLNRKKDDKGRERETFL